MSHFSVLVITDRKPSHADLAAILQPWHEFECTGVADQYVIDKDITAEARGEYESSTETRLRDPAGGLHSPYSDKFYREPTAEESAQFGCIAGTGGNGTISWTSTDWGDGRGYRTKVKFIPEGWEEVQVPTSDVETFAEWINGYYGLDIVSAESEIDTTDTHKYGHVLVDGKGRVVRAVDRTNPNKKWDWWTVGGRYTGKLAAGYDPAKDPANTETCWLCGGTGKRTDMLVENGCNGCDGTGRKLTFASDWLDVGNQARVGDLNFEAMLAAARAQRAERWDACEAKYADKAIAGFSFTQALSAWNDRLTEFLADPGPTGVRGRIDADEHAKALQAAVGFADWEGVPYDAGTREQFLDAAQPLTAFALVKDGQWYERGKMGWFACVSNEKAADQWDAEVAALLAGLPADAWLTVIDCHI